MFSLFFSQFVDTEEGGFGLMSRNPITQC